MKWKETALVAGQERIAEGICSLWLQTEQIAEEAVPGQFLALYSREDSRMLPRPMGPPERFGWSTG